MAVVQRRYYCLVGLKDYNLLSILINLTRGKLIKVTIELLKVSQLNRMILEKGHDSEAKSK